MHTHSTMSKAQFSNYPGTESFAETYHYSQAVRIGNILRISGQGGWDKDGKVAADPKEQISLALQNILAALRAAEPSAGWHNVVSVRSFHTDIAGAFEVMTKAFKELGPDHRPTWTCVEVRRLALEEMVVEIEAEALI
ncbi:endoribonuclease L-PSP [Microdochium trichocladiopsis]|uniref:Endoribonuclease L-PSP n=1 Tax=Microdochium trichocladiopsis TaxID=1682393 RepID=A0A9P9BJ83_9PEZI|nr:endoribonuclease L-PSP [Microdochium trichocladiopsis]KAH7024983.1 endoribonuclease L-PSP [Microdochium trichocladiopsis]